MSGWGDAAGRGLLGLSVQDLLGAVSARSPAPGGGSAAALTAALAASLTGMAARFAASGSGADTGDVAARADALRDTAAELADEDARAYGRYLDAVRTRRRADGANGTTTLPDHEAGIEEARALSAASDVPLRIAQVAAEVADLAAALVRSGNPRLAGDAATAVLLAAAAARSAALLVAGNLASSPGDARRGAARAASDRAAAAAASLPAP